MGRNEHDRGTGRGRAVAQPEADWPRALSYWRTYAAESFDAVARAEIAECVARTSSTIPEWREAVRGSAPAACGLALRLGHPARIGARIDLVMTTLLHWAFENAVAAEALSEVMQRMPIEARERARISASWMVHRVWLSRRRRAGRRRPAPNDDGGSAA